jgi:hypothetical protein
MVNSFPLPLMLFEIHKGLIEHVIKKVIPEKYLDGKTIFHLNPPGTPLSQSPRSTGPDYVLT